MPWTDKHIEWLANTGTTLKTVCGKTVPIFELRHTGDAKILSAWAKHLRNHYCLDTQIDALRNGTPHSRAEYLRSIKFPDRRVAPGPSIRAGDLGEILVADYVQYVLDFWVPRTRYANKAVRNESTKGSDIIGFKILNPERDSKNDILALFESKAQLTVVKESCRLQDAVDHSAKDHLRKAEALNAIKQRLIDEGKASDVGRVERFQNPEDRPFSEQYGAAALFITDAFCATTARKTDTRAHPYTKTLALIVIKGDDFMRLVHDLYERAADEA